MFSQYECLLKNTLAVSCVKSRGGGGGHASPCTLCRHPYLLPLQASSLVVSLSKELNGIASTFEWLDWYSSLTWKSKRPLHCLLAESWQINKQISNYSKVELSCSLPCPSAQQANLLTCYLHYCISLMLNLWKNSNFSRLLVCLDKEDRTQVYRLRSGCSNHQTMHAPINVEKVANRWFV